MTEPFYAPRFEIRISGVTMAADVADQVLSLTVETSLDLAGSFGLVLRNPDNRLLDSPLLDLGKTVEIYLGYGATLQPALLGEIAAIEPSFPRTARRRSGFPGTTSPTRCAVASPRRPITTPCRTA